MRKMAVKLLSQASGVDVQRAIAPEDDTAGGTSLPLRRQLAFLPLRQDPELQLFQARRVPGERKQPQPGINPQPGAELTLLSIAPPKFASLHAVPRQSLPLPAQLAGTGGQRQLTGAQKLAVQFIAAFPASAAGRSQAQQPQHPQNQANRPPGFVWNTDSQRAENGSRKKQQTDSRKEMYFHRFGGYMPREASLPATP